MHDRFRAASLLALAVLTLTGCKSSNNVQLSGAGSTFVYPVMTLWIQDFSQSHPSVQINYQSIGSGGGIQQVKAGTVDFGASDVPLADDQLSSMPPVIQIPETAGPVCITYNLGESRGRSSSRLSHWLEFISEPSKAGTTRSSPRTIRGLVFPRSRSSSSIARRAAELPTPLLPISPPSAPNGSPKWARAPMSAGPSDSAARAARALPASFACPPALSVTWN